MVEDSHSNQRETSQTQEGGRRAGVPQGSPLSPILSNIMLHELDKEMEKRGLKYVRYADDFSIYTKSQSEARQVGNSIFLFLRDKLKLPINRQKSHRGAAAYTNP